MAKKIITTTREYDAEGRLTKETVIEEVTEPGVLPTTYPWTRPYIQPSQPWRVTYDGPSGPSPKYT